MFKYFYIDEKTRQKIEISADGILLECENGESFKLLGRKSDGDIVLSCEGRLSLEPRASNCITVKEI